MSTINQLSSINSTELTTSDNFVIYSNANGDARKLSAGQLLDYIRTNLTDSDYLITITTPADGFNITVTQDGQDRWALLRPTGALLTGTLVLPAPSVAADGQRVLVTTTNQVATFTVDGNGATEVNGIPLVLSAGDSFELKYNAQTTSWYKVA
jgi:hypothetical protein